MHSSIRPGPEISGSPDSAGIIPEHFHHGSVSEKGEESMKGQIATIDEYIASFPPAVQEKLREMRAVIHRAAPDAEEAIRYGIPTLRLDNHNLVHFAAFKDHLSFFPTPSGIRQFAKELSSYTLSKGTIRFTLDKPVPYDLVERITRFRVEETRKNRKT
jgi:uncharacterized protein YdhG (YjbR/CyaY superfamily)